eukprot:5681006-Pleurochrysis_carterae.AAC.1
MGGQPEKAETNNDQGACKHMRTSADQNARIRLRACVCSKSTPRAQRRPLACLRKESRRATRRVPCSALSQPSLRKRREQPFESHNVQG